MPSLGIMGRTTILQQQRWQTGGQENSYTANCDDALHAPEAASGVTVDGRYAEVMIAEALGIASIS